MLKLIKSTFLIFILSMPSFSAQSYADLLEEVVVTAQKRSENMQDVPISISAQSGEILNDLNIAGSDDLNIAIPGLQIGRQTNGSVAFIRGVGNNNSAAGNEPSVPIYVDGVYNPSMNANIMAFNNIERIEVLKGPQGTVFGRNATGGIIHVITKDPEEKASGKLTIGYGNFSTIDTSLYATTGVAENLMTDVAVLYSDRSGTYMDNLNGPDLGDHRNFQVRNKWIFSPQEETVIRASISYGKDDGSAGMSRSRVGTSTDALGFGVGHVGDYYTTQQDHPGFYKHETQGLSLQLGHELTDSVSLVSITGYSEVDVYYQLDFDATPFPFAAANIDIGSDALSQEVRFVSDWDKDWDWIAGIYYFDYEAAYEPLQIVGALGDVIANGPPGGGLIGLGFLPAGSGGPLNNYAQIATESLATFGEVNWNITDSTKLTLGLRYTEDSMEFSGMTLFTGPTGSVTPGTFSSLLPSGDDSVDFDEVTYRFVIDHKLSESMLLYASYSTGYKAGVFNAVVLTGIPTAALDPETVDAIELGLKSDLLDDKLRVNAALFSYDYEQLQFSTLSVGGLTTSAADAEIQGAELEVIWAASENLDLQLGASFTDGEFTANNDPNKGNDLIRSPDKTANLIANYSIPSTVGTFMLSGIIAYQSEMAWDPDNIVIEDAYTLANASVAWISNDEHIRVTFWGKNITDKEYANYGNFNAQFGELYAAAEPRTYGVNVELSF